MYDKTDTDKIWAGDPSSILTARHRFLTGNDFYDLLPYASALYSFRENPIYAKELDKLRENLVQMEKVLSSRDHDQVLGSYWADRVDMLTTFYLWFSARSESEGASRVLFRRKAVLGCRAALPHREEILASKSPHSYHLIALTYVSQTCNEKEVNRLINDTAWNAANDIKDPRQKARVFIKLGIVIRDRTAHVWESEWWRGLFFGIRGCLVLKVPLNVRAKGLAALCGVKR